MKGFGPGRRQSGRPPRFQGGGAVKRAATRFDTLPTIDGYDVIDYDGRAVDHFPNYEAAKWTADSLNDDAFASTRQLVRSLSTETA